MTAAPTARRGRKRRHTSPAAPTASTATTTAPLLDARGYERSTPTMPGAGKGRPSPLKGRKFPPNPPNANELITLLQAMPESPHGRRLRALVIVMWRSGLRISEALALETFDLDAEQGAIAVRRGKGSRHRVVGMDRWGWGQLKPWLREREAYPDGPVFCVLQGPTAGVRAVGSAQVRLELRRLRDELGLHRRTAPHQYRHRMAVDYREENIDVYTLQRQLGHTDLSVTSRYLVSVNAQEIVKASVKRDAPKMAVPDLMAAFRGR